MEFPSSHIQPAKTEPLSVTEAVALFDRLANMDHLAFDWAKEGCYARAHLMCREIQDHGHMPSKAWAFEEEKGLTLLTPEMGQVKWWYHVAPALPVQRANGDVQLCVFDPAIYDGPVPLEQWATMFGARPEKTCVAAFGVGPFGTRSDYRPQDQREGFTWEGEATTDKTDQDAEQQVLANLDIIKRYGVAPRIVYSSPVREEAEAAFGHALPREGKRWVSMPLHRARQQDNDEVVEKLTQDVRPTPQPASRKQEGPS